MARCASMISAAVTPVEIELHRERLGEQAGIALRDPRAAAGADLDLDDALRLERAQRVARHDPAHPEALGKVLFGAEEIARPQLLGEQRLAHLARRSGSTWWRCGREDLARSPSGWVQTHGAFGKSVTASREYDNNSKDNIFSPSTLCRSG